MTSGASQDAPSAADRSGPGGDLGGGDGRAESAIRLERALAELDARINWERRGRGRMRVTLEPARDLCRRLGHPERGPRVVHVTGSKGKGSVSALVSAALTAAGFRTGRYASPHVERLAERVTVDGVEAGDAELAQGLERALAACRDAEAEATPAREATWFDLLTAAAWCVFAGRRVDWLVAECGIGGRFDSTNTLSGEVCVITNVELEHTNVLGPTRAAIAAEKVGILDPGAVLVTGVPEQDEAGRVLTERAAALGARLLRPHVAADATVEECNVALAGAVLDALGQRGQRGRGGDRLSASLLTPAVVAAARLPGRLEPRRSGTVPVLLDGAHTPGSAAAVVRDLASPRGPLAGTPWRGRPPVAVLGMAIDKDLPGILKSLLGAVDRGICTSVGGPLARGPEEIGAAARELGLVAETAASPRMALERARDLAEPDGWVLVLGSLYLVGALRTLTEPGLPIASPC